MTRRTLFVPVVLVVIGTTFARGQAPTAASQADPYQIKIFALQNSPAEEAMSVLTAILVDSNQPRRSANPYDRAVPGRVKMAVHESTNSLVVRGPADTLAVAESIVQRLDERSSEQMERDTYADLRRRVADLEALYRRVSSPRSRGGSSTSTRPRSSATLRGNAPPTATRQPEGRAEKKASPDDNTAATGISAPARSPTGKGMLVKRIIQPGTKVKKGEVLVELEVAGLPQLIEQRRVELQERQAQLKEIESQMAAAEAEGSMVEAELEQRVGLSELALTTYRKATADVEIKELEGEVAAAKSAVEQLEAAVKQAEIPMTELESARRKLDLAQVRLSAMVEVEVPAQITRLEGERKLAQLALKLIRDKLASEQQRLQADKAAALINLKLLEDKILKLEKAKGGVAIEAPHDGIVDPRSGMLQIKPGLMVRENQTLLILARPKNKMD